LRGVSHALVSTL